MNAAEEKITKAKVRLILTQPFFATLAMGLKYVEDKTIQTANIDGRRIAYSPDFINKLDVDDVTGLIAHEVMHMGLLHHLRAKGKKNSLWQQACDYAINGLLTEAKVKIPDGGLIDSRFNNMSAEQIYKQLEKEQPPEDKNKGNDPNGNGGNGKDNGNGKPKPEQFGEVKFPDDIKTESELQQAESEMKQKLVQAHEAAKQAGKKSLGIEKLVTELLQPNVAWNEVLNRFISEIAHNDYNWKLPNRRYIVSGLYLPALENTEVGKIACIIDTSGSIYSYIKILNTFVSELDDIAGMFNMPITVIHADSRVVFTHEFEQGEKIVPKGGGGTDFRPAIEWINNNMDDVKAVLYFTDGECWRFPKEPEYPVLWALYGDHKFNPPFGEVIHVDERS